MMSENDHKMLTRSKTDTIIDSIKHDEELNINKRIKTLFYENESSSKKGTKKTKLKKKQKSRQSPISFIIEDSGDEIEHPLTLSQIAKLQNLKSLLSIYDTDIDICSEDDDDSEDNSDDEIVYDELDEQFIEITEETLNDDKNLEYFHKLDQTHKKLTLANINKLNQINNKNIPLKFKILNSNMPEETKAYALSLLDKIDNDSETSESYKLNKWIEGLISIPFGEFINMNETNEKHGIEKIEDNRYILNVHKCLNNAIYGHQEAKCHILQLVAKWLKNKDSNGNVLAIQGPMGNGKTTLVKEGIAKALNRPFAFISLGGASDSSYLNGHSLTYEGSVWGRIVDIFIKSKCMNPIIYFDELDKVSETTKGEEIIHLLTHITDFSQNDRFQDNYFSGIDLDLSKVLFIFSFNNEENVNKILKDRMNVINTKGFKCSEKIKISKEYLLPTLYESFKFTKNDILFTDSIIEYIISNYTYKEEGVRNLQRALETLLSKLNIYNMYSDISETEDLGLNYKIKDFKIPYTLTLDTVTTLLQINRGGNNVPSHMYM